MRRAAPLLVAALTAIGAAACSSQSPTSRPTRTAVPRSPKPTLSVVSVNQGEEVLIAPRSGTGPTTVGAFTPTTAFTVMFSCVGPGGITVDFSPDGSDSSEPCNGILGGFVYGSPQRIEHTLSVTVDATTRWTVAVVSSPGVTPSP